MSKFDCMVRFVPPPWLWGEEPRDIYFSTDTSLYDVLLNYYLFFGMTPKLRKNRLLDIQMISSNVTDTHQCLDDTGYITAHRDTDRDTDMFSLSGFFYIRSSDEISDMNHIPEFPLTRLSDFCSDLSELIEIGYLENRETNVSSQFIPIRKEIEKSATNILSYLLSYRRILSKSN